jgi:hypothetical protein
MKSALTSLAGAAVILATGAAVRAHEPQVELKPVESFAPITDQKERAVALFKEAGKVIMHARCVNCHPAGERPFQGDDRHPHMPLVVRGIDDFGAVGMRCPTCHGPKNFDAGRVPGNPTWHMAPIEMAWVGKSLGEICQQIKDPARNGGKTLDDLVHHMGEDPLVGWSWHPGVGREPAPGTQKELGELIKAWVDAGAACPAP